MSLQSATALAIERGYRTVSGPQPWHGLDVYTPIDDFSAGDDLVPRIGTPFFIFDDGTSVRFSTVDESIEFLADLDDEE